MNKTKIFLLLLACIAASLSAKAQTYHEDDKEGLRMFLRQESADTGQINAEKLGLSISDTTTWQSSETWVDTLIKYGVAWNNDSPQRLTGIFWEDWLNHLNLKGTLDASKWTELTRLECGWNKLTSLDLSKNTALTYLRCGDNNIDTLDVTANTNLTYLQCSYQDLKALIGVNACTALTFLECKNQLTALDVSGCKALTHLDCGRSENQLSTLDLSANTALTYLDCSNNRLPLSDLFVASERVTNQNNKYLGTQNLPPLTVTTGKELFADQAEFVSGIYTNYVVTQNDNPASPSDYTINNGTIKFNNIGTYSITMTNSAIVSNTNFPAEVKVDISVSYTHISGTIYHQDSTTTLDSGAVYLYPVQSGIMYPTDTAFVQSGGKYTFTNVADGEYWVKVVPNNRQFAPTYYEDTKAWDDAQTKKVTISNNISKDSIDIWLPAAFPPLENENSLIHGTVEEGDDSQKSEGEPIRDVGVILMRPSQGSSWETVGYTYTDDTGYFAFPDLPAGRYKIVADVPGMGMENQVDTNVGKGDTVFVEIKMIKKEVGIKQLRGTSYKLQVYPNPTKGQLIIDCGDSKGACPLVKAVEIYNVVGQCVFTTPNPTRVTTPNPSEGGESPTSAQFPSFGGAGVVIDVSHLPAGMYFLKINNKVVKFLKE